MFGRDVSDQPSAEILTSPLLVVGMHNSGTSILAEILDRHGIFLGVDGAHHENRFFRNEVNEGLVMGAGDSWARLPLLGVDEVLGYEGIVREHLNHYFVERYRACGWDGRSPWGFKDPRTCVLLPLYLVLFPNARVLHIVRDPDDVAASLAHKPKRSVGVLRDQAHWKRLALAYVERVRECVAGSSQPSLEISYEGMCRNPEAELAPVFAFAGLAFDDAARAFASRRLEPSRIGSARRSALGWGIDAIKQAVLGRR